MNFAYSNQNPFSLRKKRSGTKFAMKLLIKCRRFLKVLIGIANSFIDTQKEKGRKSFQVLSDSIVGYGLAKKFPKVNDSVFYLKLLEIASARRSDEISICI